MKVRQNLRVGIPPQRAEMYILSYKLALFSVPGMKIGQSLL